MADTDSPYMSFQVGPQKVHLVSNRRISEKEADILLDQYVNTNQLKSKSKDPNFVYPQQSIGDVTIYPDQGFSGLYGKTSGVFQQTMQPVKDTMNKVVPEGVTDFLLPQNLPEAGAMFAGSLGRGAVAGMRAASQPVGRIGQSLLAAGAPGAAYSGLSYFGGEQSGYNALATGAGIAGVTYGTDTLMRMLGPTLSEKAARNLEQKLQNYTRQSSDLTAAVRTSNNPLRRAIADGFDAIESSFTERMNMITDMITQGPNHTHYFPQAVNDRFINAVRGGR